MTRCKGCKGELGPTEQSNCPRHRLNSGERLPQVDLIFVVLESAPAPVSLYDIRRMFHAQFDYQPGQLSINAAVAQDRRCCWAGRGIYGLWRHGLVPGPRKLADAVRLVLLSDGQTLSRAELGFVLRQLGYRFQDSSLALVLNTTPGVRQTADREYRVMRAPDDRKALRIRLRLSTTEMDIVTKRVRRNTRKALVEYRRRREAARKLTQTDTIWQNAELTDPAIF